MHQGRTRLRCPDCLPGRCQLPARQLYLTLQNRFDLRCLRCGRLDLRQRSGFQWTVSRIGPERNLDGDADAAAIAASKAVLFAAHGNADRWRVASGCRDGFTRCLRTVQGTAGSQQEGMRAGSACRALPARAPESRAGQ